MSESFMNDAFSTPLQCEGIQENEMKKKKYVAPMSLIVSMQMEYILGTSVSHNAAASQEEDWNEQEIDGGEIDL
ncbi:hypothetical protein [Prevotella sp. HJM029]|jgi:hypothetical protein|uniref:hypothetical protein n=1 Tax=Prevotella sp. HJM029 TaxID=1433844 RepID=UPI00048B4560|nr:hypothetical protein [Prevotella sp. HJM029]MBF1586819.1 hypothetical protein [Prevotella sp.]